MRLTDRSRIIAHQRCPRERYLAYEWNGTGLQRKRKGLALSFGSAFHEGTEVLLTTQDIDAAVMHARGFLQDQFNNSLIEFEGEIPQDALKAAEYGKGEQEALVEALLRGWWAFEGEAFLRDFEVVEVEREGRAGLSGELVLMFCPDALVRDRASGDLYVVSWKTAATFGKRNVDQARHDMQSMSEVWGLTQTIQALPKHPAQIEGVLYKWIVKGRRNQDDFDGLYKQDTHLIYGWRNLKPADGENEWSWSYKWKDDEINPKTGKQVGHTLGKGWKKVPIWEEYPGGVKQWIEDLSQRKVFPRHVDALESVFPQSLPVERRVDEVERWKNQVIGQETKIALTVEDMQRGMTPEQLDVWFPQYTHSCHSYKGCAFIPVCWDGVAAEVGELYQIRTQNHPEKENDDG